MDKIGESKYKASGVSVLRNSDGELISVVRVDATRYLDDPIVDKFLNKHNFILFDIKRYYWKRKQASSMNEKKGQLIFSDTMYFQIICIHYCLKLLI